MGGNESFFGHNIPVGGGGGEGGCGHEDDGMNPQANQNIFIRGRVLRNNYYLEGVFHTVTSSCNS